MLPPVVQAPSVPCYYGCTRAGLRVPQLGQDAISSFSLSTLNKLSKNKCASEDAENVDKMFQVTTGY